MTKLRALGLVLWIASLAHTARSDVFAYEEVGIAGRNNVIDSTAASCDSVEGCYTRTGARCSDNPNQRCDLQIVPAGRCSYGNLAAGPPPSCVWPHRAGHCSGNPKVGCLTNDQCADAGGTCLLTTDVFGAPYEPTACTCQGTNPAGPGYEATVCGGAPAICSDGDPLRAVGGLGVAYGVELSLGGLPTFPELGPVVTGSIRPDSTPVYELENPPSVFDPQRDAGAVGRAGNFAPIHPVRTTNARQVLRYKTPVTEDFVDAQMYDIYGDSYWSDWTFETGLTTGSFNTHVVTVPCDFPIGWMVGSALPNGLHCHQAARNGKGFAWRSDLTPAQVSLFTTAGGQRICPPNCNKDFSLATSELQELFETAAQDPNAGIQLAVQSGDEGPDRQAGSGDAIEVTQLFRGLLIVDADLRCKIGGWDTGLVGRCVDGPAACSPNIGCTAPGQGVICRSCGGPYDPDTNPLGLPVGYNTHGRPELDLVAGRRVGGITGHNFDVKIPLYLIGTTGNTTAEFRDIASEGLPAVDISDMGPVELGSGFASGIGAGGIFVNGVDLNIWEDCCGTGAGVNVPWDPAQLGTVEPDLAGGFKYRYGPGVGDVHVSDWALTYDKGPGPDGIPGCFGDNEVNPQTGALSCRQRLGVGPLGAQTSGFFATGQDDRAQMHPVGASTRPASTARFFWGPSPPSVVAYYAAEDNPPIVNTTAAYAARDVTYFTARSADLLMKVNTTACPLTNAGPQCERVPIPCAGQGGDSDGDTICNDFDNCPTLANTDQADGGVGPILFESTPDGVGNACDNCVNVGNPRVAANFLTTDPWATLSGGQRDDDHDGYGNKCDAKFVGLPSANVGGLDLAQFRASNAEDRRLDTCGTANTRPCAIFDLDELGTAISGLDLGRLRALNSAPPGPRCASCTGTGSATLPCTAGTAGSCSP